MDFRQDADGGNAMMLETDIAITPRLKYEIGQLWALKDWCKLFTAIRYPKKTANFLFGARKLPQTEKYLPESASELITRNKNPLALQSESIFKPDVGSSDERCKWQVFFMQFLLKTVKSCMQARKQLLLLINGLKNVDCDFLFNILAGERQNLDHIFGCYEKGLGLLLVS